MRSRRPVRLGAGWSLAVVLLCAGAQAQPPTPALPAGVDLSKPLTLAECIQVALAANPSLAIAAHQVRRADAAVTQAQAGWLPELSFDWSGRVTKSLARPVTVGGNVFAGSAATQTQRDLELTLSQTFFRSGLQEQIESARASADAARWGQDDSRRTVALRVAQGYFSTLAAQGLAEVAQRAVDAAAQHLEAADARIQAGTAAAADRFPFEVELQQARVQALAAANLVQTTLNSLKETMGLPTSAPLQLAESLGRPSLLNDLDALQQAAYRSRPDVRQQQAQVEASRLSLRLSEIQRGPVFAASGSDNYGRHTGVTGNAWQVMASVSFPVFDGGLTQAQVESARASLAIAEETLRQIQLAVSLEVENAYLSAMEANARIDAATAATTSARVSRDAAQEKYAAGVGTVIEVTDAEQKLRQAEADEVKAYYDYNIALAALRAAIGEMVGAGGP
jgi:outer membrane protein